MKYISFRAVPTFSVITIQHALDGHELALFLAVVRIRIQLLHQLHIVALPRLRELIYGITRILRQRSIVAIHGGKELLIHVQDVAHGSSGSTAQEGVRFQNDDTRATCNHIRSSRQTRSARADDDDVSRRFGFHGGLFGSALRLIDAAGDRLQHRIAGDRRTGDSIHLSGLRLHDGRNQFLQRHIAQALGFLLAHGSHGNDGGLAELHLHFHRTAHAITPASYTPGVQRLSQTPALAITHSMSEK